MTTTQQKTYWQFGLGALQSAAGWKKGRNEQLFKHCHYLWINISDNSVFIDEKDSKYSILLLRSISKIVVNNIVRLSNISFSPFYSSSRHKSRLWYISFLVWYIKNYLCTKLPPWRSLYLVPFSFYLWQLTVWIMLLKRQKHSNNQYQMSILSDFKGVFS